MTHIDPPDTTLDARVEQLVGPRPDFDRDRWGRPLVAQPDGTRKPYTRCTTLVGAAEDMFNVNRWERRMVALGLADRKDLLLAVAAHREDKTRLNKLCEEAKGAARGSAAATTGTAIHALTELVDSGRPLPTLPDDVTRSLDAYTEATADLKAIAIEQHLVNDRYQVAGTADRIVSYHGHRVVMDLKTGSTIELGIGKIAGQLATYARSVAYDVADDTRGAPHGASVHWGLIVHLPANRPGVCELVWVDLLAGWSWVHTCLDVCAKRAWHYRQLTRGFNGDGPPPDDEATHPGRQPPAQATTSGTETAPGTYATQIRACATADAVRGLWAAHAASWDDADTAAAKAHIASLPGHTPT